MKENNGRQLILNEKGAWSTWLFKYSHNGHVYFMLNRLSASQPLEHFYQNYWVAEADPLYNGTPMKEILAQSPWLIRAHPAKLNEIATFLDSNPALDWGWAYYSDWTWEEQRDHWKNRMLIKADSKWAVLRLMDTRVLSVLAPALRYNDWKELFSPASEFAYYDGELHIYQTPENYPLRPDATHYMLPDYLIDAWNKHPKSIDKRVFEIECDLWEEYGERAEYYYQKWNDLKPAIKDTLTQMLEEGYILANIKAAMVLKRWHDCQEESE